MRREEAGRPDLTASVSGTVAVVGLGAIGSRLAARIRGAGYETVAWNRTQRAAWQLAQPGVTAVATPAEAAVRAGTVIVTVADPAALASVTDGPEGIAAGIRPGTQLIVMSTVDPAAIMRLARALPEGVELLDAPFLGSLAEAEQGRLQIFVGGTDAAARRAEPVLRTLGTSRHLGGLGAGSAAKLVVNCALLGVLAVLGEAVALSDRLGLPREHAFEVLALTPLAGQAERRRPALDSGRYPPRFRLELARKDTDLMIAAAGLTDDVLPVLQAVRTWLLRAESQGRGDDDYTAVLVAIADRQGGGSAD